MALLGVFLRIYPTEIIWWIYNVGSPFVHNGNLKNTGESRYMNAKKKKKKNSVPEEFKRER